MRVKMTVAVAALAGLLLSLPAASYANRTIQVSAGESIQAAIDDAKPYTTIEVGAGTYAESLLIKKDGIHLVGAGRKKTKLVPPANPTPGAGCADPQSPSVNGICVFDVDDQFNVQHRVKGVTISNLSVSGFNGIGIFFVGTKDGTVTRTITSNNDEYGIFFNNSTGAVISRNVTGQDDAEKAPEAGIYVGDSPEANATLWKNVSYGNVFGIFIRDAANGKVLKNKTFSNCAGILFLNTNEADVPPGQTPGPSVDVSDWLAQQNISTANNKVCTGEGDEPPFSGFGIIVLAGSDIDIIDNGVFGNKAPPAPDAPPPGGIVIAGDPSFKVSTDIKVAFNTAFGNAPYDLFWDEAEGSTARFLANDCLTSHPDGLCEDPDAEGDDNGSDEHGDEHRGDHRENNHQKHSKHKHHKRHKHHND